MKFFLLSISVCATAFWLGLRTGEKSGGRDPVIETLRENPSIGKSDDLTRRRKTEDDKDWEQYPWLRNENGQILLEVPIDHVSRTKSGITNDDGRITAQLRTALEISDTEAQSIEATIAKYTGAIRNHIAKSKKVRLSDAIEILFVSSIDKSLRQEFYTELSAIIGDERLAAARKFPAIVEFETEQFADFAEIDSFYRILHKGDDTVRISRGEGNETSEEENDGTTLFSGPESEIPQWLHHVVSHK